MTKQGSVFEVAALAVAVALTCLPASVDAAVIHVPGDQPTIQAGVNVALAGDTVSVEPGTYFENVLIEAKSLTLLGDVVGQTVVLRPNLSQKANYAQRSPHSYLSKLDTVPAIVASAFPAGGGSNQLTLLNSVSGVVVITGFTFEHSNVAPALLCQNSISHIDRNVFQDNEGGGVLCASGQRSTVTNNSFLRNSAYAGGGLAMIDGASADLYDNEFLNNRAFLGGGAFCINDDGHTISGNRFVGNYATAGGGGIYYYHGGVANVTGNLFVDDTSNHGGGVDNSDRQYLLLTYNTFDRCVSGISNGGGNAAWWAHGAPIGGQFKNNIVTNTHNASGVSGSLGCDPEIVGLVEIDYNDFHANGPANVFRFGPGPNDIFADPMYCDAANGDYSLDSASPSAGTAEGGGNRGAYATGCSAGAIAVDVLPRNCPNTISIGELALEYQGVHPGPAAVGRPGFGVAIVGTKAFNAASVDPSSVQVAGLSPASHRLIDVSRPVESPESICECNASGPDGITDLVLYFDQEEFLAAWGPVTDGEVRVLDLVGATKSGLPLTGSDCLKIVDGPIHISPSTPYGGKFKTGINVRPNPFNAIAVIDFTLATEQHVRVDIYDVLGRKVETLANHYLSAGSHELIWDGVGRASGVYFARLVTADASITKQMVLMK